MQKIDELFQKKMNLVKEDEYLKRKLKAIKDGNEMR
jgi:hypothetical protein